MNAAILVAAGSSTRMRSAERKPFLELEGRPVLEWTCEAFDRARTIDRIVIVCHADDVERIRDMATSRPTMKKVERVVPGGLERIDSVREGVAALSDEIELVAIHDAARPLVEPDAIDRTMAQADERGSAILAIPVTDTIKTSVDGYEVEHTLDRSVLWRAQTPQAFRLAALREHLDRALEDGFIPTDESSMFERYSGAVSVVKGSEDNLKLTTPRDLELAAAILRVRRAGA